MIFWRSRIVAASAPRMTAANPFAGQPDAGNGSVRMNDIHRILRARWRETATAGRTKQENLHWRKRPAINADGKNQNVLQQIHGLILQQTSPAQNGQEILFHFGEAASGNRRARHQDQFHRLGKFVLMLPETFPQQPSRPAAHHRPADAPAGDDAQLRMLARRQRVPVGNQTTERQPPAQLSDTRKIAALCEPRAAAQTQAFRRFGGHERGNQTGVRRLRPTRRRLASVALPLLLELRLRNPCCRLRRIFDG
jgi:hypothetical protein